MNREDILKNDKELLEFYLKFKELYNILGDAFLERLNRFTSTNDLFFDRWDKAKKLNFGENTNIYDNSLVIGNVRVGKECWIGPNTILDGSGNLLIGDFCTISAGVQIYTHDNVKQTLSSKLLPIEHNSVEIGNNVYIAPNAVITKGVSIGNNVVIGAFAFVNKNIASNSIVVGQPAKVIGEVIYVENEIKYNYF